MSQRRLTVTIAGLVTFLFFGFLLVDSLNQYCRHYLIGECQRLWILTGISVFGSVFFFEILLAHHFRNKPDTAIVVDVVQQKGKTSSTQNRNVWSRSFAKSTIRLTLSTLLIGMPLLVQGIFVATVGSIFVGVGTDMFVRGIMNWLPTKHKN